MTPQEAIAAACEGFAKGLARAFSSDVPPAALRKRGRRPARVRHSRAVPPASAPPPDQQSFEFGGQTYDIPPTVDFSEMDAVLNGQIKPGFYVPGEGLGAGDGVT